MAAAAYRNKRLLLITTNAIRIKQEMAAIRE